MARDKFARQSLGGSLHSKIKEARILLVGAGGIGCELLKNLVLTGFGNIHIVDLDTIDLSNLNRQFLFRHEHIKKSKALVAKESASKFNPNVQIEAHHANIKDPKFDVEWLQTFTIVFNALDNIDARRHVNKMCIAADVPLIESGTTGFNGQVQVIRKGKTECYDCNPKETPKSFPVCTIRSTPSQPIHCIVWAKSYLFSEIFGLSEDDSQELDHSEDADNSVEIEKLRQEAAALKKIRASMNSDDFPRLIFEKVFSEDVKRLRSMEDMWKAREPPEPLDYEMLSQEASSVSTTIAHQDQIVWTLAENVAVFQSSLKKLSDGLKELRDGADAGDAPPILTFDKDDKDTLDFVAASANLRSHIFGIDMRSEFEIKQMAGNIIPAIATTNAMVAGLCVLQAFKVMRNDLAKARMVFLTTSTDRVISAETLRPPKADCPMCSVAQAKLLVDPARATLKDLTEDILKNELSYGAEFSVSSDAGVIYDPELDDNLPKRLSELGIEAGTFLTIVDEDDEPRVDLRLAVTPQSSDEDAKPVQLLVKPEIGKKPAPAPAESASQNGNGIVNGAAGSHGGTKRKRSADDSAEVEAEQTHKRGKVPEAVVSADTDDDVVFVNGATGGAIIIDD